MCNHGAVGVSSEFRRFGCSSLWYTSKLIRFRDACCFFDEGLRLKLQMLMSLLVGIYYEWMYGNRNEGQWMEIIQLIENRWYIYKPVNLTIIVSNNCLVAVPFSKGPLQSNAISSIWCFKLVNSICFDLWHTTKWIYGDANCELSTIYLR